MPLHLIISKDGSYNSSVAKTLVAEHIGKPAAGHGDAVDVFEGKTIDLQQLDNALYTDSLIAGNKAIVMNNIEYLKPDAIAMIARFSETAPGHILLVMTCENADALKQNRFEAFRSLRKLKKHTALQQTAYSLFQDYLKKHNIRITKAALDMLVNVFEAPTWGMVENEMNKLSTYAGRNGEIDENAVSELTFNLDRADTFQFVNELLAHKTKPALKDLKRIKDTGVETIMVIGALAWKFRQLLQSTGDAGFIRRLGLLYDYNLSLRKGMLGSSVALDKLAIELLNEKFY